MNMAGNKNEAPTVIPGDSPVPLESVLCTEELNRRPSRPPDYEKESRALTALAQALADSPRTILQQLAETILEVFQSDSAGISLLTTDDGGKRFHWPAIAGVWKPHIGGGTPRDFGPCGDVLDRNAPLLFRHFERRYPYFLPVTPPVEECLLVPFYVGGKAVGTIWAIAHTDRRKFDAEDMRQLVSLGNFASSAYQAVALLDALEQRVVELQTLNVELGASEARYRTLFERIDQGFCIIEKVEAKAGEPLDFRYIDVNPAFATQSGVAGVVGKTIRQAVPGESEEWLLVYDTVLRTGEPIRFERELATQGRVLELYAFRVEDKTHRRIAVMFSDITERKRAEEERAGLAAQMREANEHLIVGTLRAQTMTEVADEANHLKDEFLATVSHELRTPLNAIVGWARILGGKASPPDLAGRGIAAIERNAWALAHIIDDLLDVSRIATGTLQMAAQPVDLAAVAQTALDTVRPLAALKNVQLVFSPDLRGIQSVSGDAGRLEQVIWNLVANAIKFTPEGGRVEVLITPSGDHMEIRVVDTGKGISPDFLPHVFARFRQGDDATIGRHTGLGLGLSIVRQLVELHRGTVHAASEGVGRGATFTVRLPISAVDQATALRERRTAPPMVGPTSRLPRLDGLRIMVVDDSADGRDLTSLVLTQAGGTVKAVASAREALVIFELERPDALVTEIALPGEDGYELLRQIRQYEADHGGLLPAVALTSYARAEDRARVLAAGFQAHLPKPVDPVDLTAAIATMTHPPSNSDA
jgi:PAS domain S-box-containing protein